MVKDVNIKKGKKLGPSCFLPWETSTAGDGKKALERKRLDKIQ